MTRTLLVGEKRKIDSSCEASGALSGLLRTAWTVAADVVARATFNAMSTTHRQASQLQNPGDRNRASGCHQNQFAGSQSGVERHRRALAIQHRHAADEEFAVHPPDEADGGSSRCDEPSRFGRKRRQYEEHRHHTDEDGCDPQPEKAAEPEVEFRDVPRPHAGRFMDEQHCQREERTKRTERRPRIAHPRRETRPPVSDVHTRTRKARVHSMR